MIQETKSGRDVEVAFMPEHITARLNDYVAARKLTQRIEYSMFVIQQFYLFSDVSNRSKQGPLFHLEVSVFLFPFLPRLQ